MEFISIDGDDIGRKITSYYLSNNCRGLTALSRSLQVSIKEISGKLVEYGFDIIFCAADGVVASTQLTVDFRTIFSEINSLAPEGITFSAGVGNSLREAYIALMSAKSNGKSCLHVYAELDFYQKEN